MPKLIESATAAQRYQTNGNSLPGILTLPGGRARRSFILSAADAASDDDEPGSTEVT
jgi:hypothetical protein